MMRVWARVVVFSVLLLGCEGVESSTVREPDGSHGVMVKCRLGSPWRCLEELETYCPRGYTPISGQVEGETVSPLSPGLFQRGQTWFIHAKCGATAPAKIIDPPNPPEEQ